MSLDFEDYGFGIDATYTRVRGGGAAGGRAWVARILGYNPDSRWGFVRRFCGRDTSGLSGSGRSGRVWFLVEQPGLYEFADFAISSRRGYRGFFLIADDGDVRELTRPQARELAMKMNSPGRDAA